MRTRGDVVDNVLVLAAQAGDAAAFRTLPAADRLLLTLHYVDGYSMAEAAIILEVPPGTVKSRPFHARERLRAELEVSDAAHDRR